MGSEGRQCRSTGLTSTDSTQAHTWSCRRRTESRQCHLTDGMVNSTPRHASTQAARRQHPPLLLIGSGSAARHGELGHFFSRRGNACTVDHGGNSSSPSSDSHSIDSQSTQWSFWCQQHCQPGTDTHSWMLHWRSSNTRGLGQFSQSCTAYGCGGPVSCSNP